MEVPQVSGDGTPPAPPANEPPATDQGTSDQTNNPPDDVATDACLAEMRGRAVLRAVRRIVNDYRDDLWGRLVRERQQLVMATAVASAFAYLLLAMGLVLGVDRSVIVNGWALYVTGAVVGLFKHLYDAHNDVSGTEDYGLNRMRLYGTPLLSGMAAVLGVILVAYLSSAEVQLAAAQNNVPLPSAGASVAAAQASPTPGSASVATTPTVAQPEVLAAQALDIQKSPLSVLLAFLFGFSPSLVINRFNQAGGVKDQIQASNASSG